MWVSNGFGRSRNGEAWTDHAGNVWVVGAVGLVEIVLGGDASVGVDVLEDEATVAHLVRLVEVLVARSVTEESTAVS